jgi:2-C-methyl-D-erythritol 4-phosphate cytidylyltransferase
MRANNPVYKRILFGQKNRLERKAPQVLPQKPQCLKAKPAGSSPKYERRLCVLLNDNDAKRKVSAVIAAGGKGLRMGGESPKQYALLGGIPMLARTVEVFCSCPEVDEIVITAPKDCIGLTWEIVDSHCLGKVKAVIPGGATRQESVRLGLASCEEPEVVLIHDGARPFARRSDIEAVIGCARMRGSCALGVASKDTIKECSHLGDVVKTLDRSCLKLIQTPQGFSYRLIAEAHEAAMRDNFTGTDDTQLMERIGYGTMIIEGSYSNIKITTPEDFRYAQWLLDSGAMR